MKEFTVGYNLKENGTYETYGDDLLDYNMYWKILPKWEINNITGHIHVVLDFKFYYDYESSNLWSFDSEIEMILRKENGEEVLKKMECRYEKYSTQFAIENSVDMGDSRALKNGIFCFGKLQIHLNLRIKSTRGFQRFFNERSFTTPTNSDSEICLRIGKFSFYVDKLVLLFSSKVFRKMLTENSGVTEFEIDKDDRFDYYSSVQFLKMLYNEFDEEDRVWESLPFLAHKYDIPSMISYCEDILINDINCYSHCKAWCSGLFALSKLQVELLKSYSVWNMGILLEYMRNQGELFENGSEYEVCQQIATDKTIEAFLVKFCEVLDDVEEDYEPKSKNVCL